MSVIGVGVARVRTMLATVALIIPLVFIAQITTGAGAAEASCPSYNNPVTGQLRVSASLYATETPASYTCNNDHRYQGTFQSSNSAWRATLVFWDPVYNNRSFNPGSYSTYVHSVNIGICCGHTRLVLCLDALAYGGGVYCGWGSNFIYHPTDYVLSYANSGANTNY